MFEIDHICISVNKLKESIEFYKNFGFELFKEYHDETVDIIMLKLNNKMLEIFHYNINNPLPQYAQKVETDLKTVGTKHLALGVDNINDAKQWIMDKEINKDEIIINQGRLGRPYFFIKDPNGILIEIIEN